MITGKRPRKSVMPQMIATPWLDAEGRFVAGKREYRGQLAADVVAEDHGYVEWILRETDIDDEDAEILRVLLDRRAP